MLIFAILGFDNLGKEMETSLLEWINDVSNDFFH